MSDQSRPLGSALVHVLVVRHEDKKAKDGRDYVLSEAEAILYNDDGTVFQAGAIRIPKHLVEAIKPGRYYFHFGFVRSFKSGYFETVVTSISLADAPAKPASGKPVAA